MEKRSETDGRVIEFQAGKSHWVFSLPTLAAVIVCAVAVVYIISYLVKDPNIISNIAGVCCGVLFVGYVLYYFVMYAKSRGHITKRAVLTEEYIEAYTGAGQKRIRLSDITFSMSYTSSSNMCIVVAARDDYIVLTCSCVYIFLKSGKGVMEPFYKINDYFLKHNEKHVKYVKSKKNRKINPFVIPHFIFEIEFYTKRAEKFIDIVKEKFPAKPDGVMRGDTSMGKKGYRATVVGIGSSAMSFLDQKMVVFFGHNAGPDIAEYSVLIDGEGECDFEPSGDCLMLGDEKYRITAVGEVANKNLAELGHAVVKFDGKTEADLPGIFHVEEKEIASITVGLSVAFC